MLFPELILSTIFFLFGFPSFTKHFLFFCTIVLMWECIEESFQSKNLATFLGTKVQKCIRVAFRKPGNHQSISCRNDFFFRSRTVEVQGFSPTRPLTPSKTRFRPRHLYSLDLRVGFCSIFSYQKIMSEQLAGGVAKAVDVVVRPVMNALVFAIPIVYVCRVA